MLGPSSPANSCTLIRNLVQVIGRMDLHFSIEAVGKLTEFGQLFF